MSGNTARTWFFGLIQIRKDFKPAFLTTTGLILLFVFPLLVANHYYADDLAHSMSGETGWVSNGRPLSQLVFKLLMAGGWLNDISPIPQLIALAVLALSIVLLSERMKGHSRLISILAFLPLAISPYYLENWSYKYDSLTMSLAVLFAILPLTLRPSLSLLKRGGIATALLFISMCFYQAALNLYLGLSALFYLIHASEGRARTGVYQLAYQAPAYLLANVLYLLTIKKFVIYGEYNIFHGETALDNPGLMWHTALENHALLKQIFMSGFDGTLWRYFLPFVVLIPLAMLLILRRVLASADYTVEKTMHILLVLISPLIIYLAVYGPILLLLHPITAARTFLGASGLIAALFVLSCILLEKLPKFQYWLIVPVSGLFLLAYSVYNAQITTERLEYVIINRLISDFDRHDLDPTTPVSIVGNAPASYQSDMAKRNYPVIRFLDRNNIGQNIMWGNLQLRQAHFNREFVASSEGKAQMCNMSLLSQNSLYRLYRNDSLIVIDFDHAPC